MFALNGFLFATWVSRIPGIQARLDLSHGQLGMALLAIALGAVITMPLSGQLTDAIGSRKVLRWFAVPFCLIPPWLAVAPNLTLLTAGLFLFGAGHGALDVAMNAQAVDVEKHRQRQLMSSFHAMFSVGGLAGAGVGAVIAWLNWPPLWHFTMASLLMLALFGSIHPHFIARVTLGVPGRNKTAVARQASALPLRALLPLGLIGIFVLIGEGAMADWSAVYLQHHLGASEALAAVSYAAFSITMAIGRFTGDGLINRFGNETVVRASGLIAAAGMALSLSSPQPGLSLLGFAVTGAGFAIVVPIVFGAAAKTRGVEPGRALAAVTSMGYCGFLIGPPLIGFVADFTTLRLALGLLIVASLCVSGLAGHTRRA